MDAVQTDCEQRAFQLCPKFESTFGILGKKWNGLIIDVMLQEGPQRFRDLAHKVVKCSDRVLVERLKEMEQMGIIERKTYVDSSLIEYQLTDKGRALEPIMQAAHHWGETWVD